MTQRGFTLLEVVVALFIISTLAVAITGIAFLGTRTAQEGERKTVALGIAIERMERVRLLEYMHIGFIDGVPDDPANPIGVLTRSEALTRNDQPYQVDMAIWILDDPTTPATTLDYKVVQVTVSWVGINKQAHDTRLTTYAAYVGPHGGTVETRYFVYTSANWAQADGCGLLVTSQAGIGEPFNGPSFYDPAQCGGTFYYNYQSSFDPAQTVANHFYASWVGSRAVGNMTFTIYTFNFSNTWPWTSGLVPNPRTFSCNVTTTGGTLQDIGTLSHTGGNGQVWDFTPTAACTEI